MNVSIADLILFDYLMGALEVAHEEEEDLSKYKILSPTPKGRKVYVALVGNDTYRALNITQGSYYEGVACWNHDTYVIVDDTGDESVYHKDWFQEVTLYDEDEDELICRDIEFEKGDYIDLRKAYP